MKQDSDPSLEPSQRRLLIKALSAAGLGAGLASLVACENIRPMIQLGISISLISQAEVERYKDDLRDNIVIPLTGDEPAIEIIKPAVQGGKVGSPMSIEVRFKPAQGKKIDPASFKLYYGAFKLDVTERLLKSAKVTATGFAIDNVEIPPGEHRLVLRVSDDSGASGIRELRVKVES